MKTTFLFNKENLFIVFLFLFSLLINQYYGNRGVFPLDSFSHFDAGHRILLGEYPFKDYWAVSGPAIDYLQAVFFYLLGVAKLCFTCFHHQRRIDHNNLYSFKKFRT